MQWKGYNSLNYGISNDFINWVQAKIPEGNHLHSQVAIRQTTPNYQIQPALNCCKGEIHVIVALSCIAKAATTPHRMHQARVQTHE